MTPSRAGRRGRGPLPARRARPGTPQPTDRGSVIPLVLGFFLIALLMVAGSVAAGDAFVQQRDLQDVCDAAAVAAASAADLGASRTGAQPDGDLPLGDVQRAVATYLARDPARADVQITAQVTPDGGGVDAACRQRSTLAFGRLFGLGGGVVHTTTSTARAPLGS